MNMQRNVCHLVVVVVPLLNFWSASALAQRQQLPDISGDWRNNSGEYLEIISQPNWDPKKKRHTTAAFQANFKKKDRFGRTWFLKGTIHPDGTITNARVTIDTSSSLVRNCGHPRTYEAKVRNAKFVKTANGQKIVGEFENDMWDTENCERKEENWKSFSISRASKNLPLKAPSGKQKFDWPKWIRLIIKHQHQRNQ